MRVVLSLTWRVRLQTLTHGWQLKGLRCLPGPGRLGDPESHL